MLNPELERMISRCERRAFVAGWFAGAISLATILLTLTY